MHNLNIAAGTFTNDTPASSIEDEDGRIASLNRALLEWFNRNREMNCFLALDPGYRTLIDDDLDAITPFSGLPHADVVIGHDAFPKVQQPRLLQLDLSTPAGIDALTHSVRIAFEDRHPQSMAQGLGQRVGGWLASPGTLSEIAAYWSRLALQHDASGRACVLRFYDSRALALLWTVLTHAQRQSLLGPLTAWHVLDASAKPVSHLASSRAHAELTLSTAQWWEIHRHGLINRALALHAQACDRQPLPGDIRTAVAAAARTSRYGLTDRDDRIAFIGHALAWHPHFDMYPKVSHLLECRSTESFYTGEIAQLSAEEIDHIRQGIWYESSMTSAADEDDYTIRIHHGDTMYDYE